MKTPTDKLLPSLSNWELHDLRELQTALRGLVEALEIQHDENLRLQSQVDPAVEHRGPSQQSQSPMQGHIELKYIPRGKKMHGPYRYLRYWQDGKLRSKYLGKLDK